MERRFSLPCWSGRDFAFETFLRAAPMIFSLRPATRSDSAFVESLETICMTGYAQAIWENWSPSVARYGFDPSRHRVVAVDGRDCGVVDLWPQNDHWLLDKLYLLPEFQGKGIGAQLLALIVDEARSAGMPLRLNVLTSNPRALSFYQREGFREVARTPERITLEPSA